MWNSQKTRQKNEYGAEQLYIMYRLSKADWCQTFG